MFYGIVDVVFQIKLFVVVDCIIYGVIIFGFLCFVLIVGFIWWIMGCMFVLFQGLFVVVCKIVDGDLEVLVDVIDRLDEIGEMVCCIDVFKDNFIECECFVEECKIGYIVCVECEEKIDILINEFWVEVQGVLELVEINIEQVEQVIGMFSDWFVVVFEQG